MDYPKNTPRVLSLCTGYGGIERGLSRVFGDVTVLAHVEVEAFAVANLVSKMEAGALAPAPVWTDLKTFRSGVFRGVVDILTGGYPCQPFSAAGKRLGEEDPRHLWPHIVKIIRGCEPRWVFFENVEGHLSKGVAQVLADLEEMAYRPVAGVFSAAEVGAPHRRKRVFILAHRLSTERRQKPEAAYGFYRTDDGREEEAGRFGERCEDVADPDFRGEQRRPHPGVGWFREPVSQKWPARPGEPQHEWEAPRVVADTGCERRQQDPGGPLGDEETNGRERRDRCEPDSDNEPASEIEGRVHQQRQTQPRLGGTAYGAAHRVDRLRLCGNGVVPQTAEKAFRTLYQKLTEGVA